jgi:tetratricopeptide (TPR) repeat protein
VVNFLAARGRREEALRLAELHVDECPRAELAGALVSAMQNPPAASQDEFRRVRAFLEQKLLRADSSNAQLVFTLANLAQVEGQSAAAERLYRSALELNPQHVLAANNLAYSLALRGGELSEAARCIEQAIELAGPLPALLDTRAVLFLRRGRGADAIKDLEALLADTPLPSGEFHLCQALLATRKWSAAQSRYRTLVSAGFGAEKLNPLERPAWDELQKEMLAR